MTRISALIAAICLCSAGLASAHANPVPAPAKLVRDINRLPADSSPQNFFSVGGETYFAATSNGVGSELWKTDGTAAGTTLVRDINPGPDGSYPEQFTNVDGEIFFSATDGKATAELWKTDGTTGGTKLVKVISREAYAEPPLLWTNLGKRLIFTVGDLVRSRLWVSDGTPVGTHPISDVQVDSCVSYPDEFGEYGRYALPGCFVRYHGYLLLASNDPKLGDHLWRTDGTKRGTREIGSVDGPGTFAVLKGLVYFGSYDGSSYRLWRSDGTAGGTILVPGISFGGSIINLTTVGDKLFFGIDLVFDFKQQLWTSDGSASGSHLVHTFNGDSVDLGEFTPARTAPGGRQVLFFAAYVKPYGDEVWVSDGTAKGTHVVRDITPGGDSDPAWLTPLETGKLSVVLFAVYGTNGDRSIWRTDGTKAGTRALAHVYASGITAIKSHGHSMALFQGLDSVGLLQPQGPNAHGIQLWETNGTVKGTGILQAINPETQDSLEQPGVMLNGRLIFSADDGVHGQRPWTTNSTGNGTKPIVQIGDRFGSYQDEFTRLGGLVLFTAFDGSENEIFATNGTKAGTHEITDFVSADEDNPQTPGWLTTVGNELYFYGNDGTSGYELWKSNGTKTGTQIVKNINPNGDSYPSWLTDVSGVLYFVADDGTHGTELWTSAGTRMVRDINPGSAGAAIRHIGHVGSRVYFGAKDGQHGSEVWTTDGTEAGTHMVRDIAGGARGSDPTNFVAFDGKIFFSAKGPGGAELWSSNGSTDGTVQVKDIRPGPKSSNPSDLTVSQGRLYFRATDGVHGYELWSTKGDAATTHMVADMNRGRGASSPSGFTDWSGKLWFTADDGVHGRELWSSDGTATGTAMVQDIFPGATTSRIGWLVASPGRLYFPADDGVHGLELWSYGQ